MKTIIKYLALAVVVIAALAASFRTENLTEKNRRERMLEYKPSQLVEVMFRDSLASLASRAVSIGQLASGINDAEFMAGNSKVLGIGSPLFLVVRGEMDNPTLIDDELKATVDGVETNIPLKYIFGNTARDASGWFNIDDFRNTPDFNAVSAEMNKYIHTKVIGNNPQKFSQLTHIEFIGAVGISADDRNLTTLTVIPYILKVDNTK